MLSCYEFCKIYHCPQQIWEKICFYNIIVLNYHIVPLFFCRVLRPSVPSSLKYRLSRDLSNISFSVTSHHTTVFALQVRVWHLVSRLLSIKTFLIFFREYWSRKTWSWKKSQYRPRKILVLKKVSVSVSKEVSVLISKILVYRKVLVSVSKNLI